MRYQLRQKLLSWGDDFTIMDADGTEVFFVDGKAFSLGNKLSFQDLAGNELAFTRPREGHVATISKRYFSWSDSYGVDIAEGEDDVLILATTVVIDQVCHDGRER